MSEIPVPAPGKKLVLYHPKGDKNKFWAAIHMPDGYVEQFDTGRRKRNQAQTAAVHRIRALFRERGLKTPRQERAERGELSPYLKLKAARQAAANGVPSDDAMVPLPAGPAALPAGRDWAEGIAKIEDRFAKAFYRIQGLLLMGLSADPDDFLEHVRAIVLQATLGVETKSRAPYGTGPRAKSKRRGRPPGS